MSKGNQKVEQQQQKEEEEEKQEDNKGGDKNGAPSKEEKDNDAEVPLSCEDKKDSEEQGASFEEG